MKTMYFGIITDIEMKAIKAIAFDTNSERDAAWKAVRAVRYGGCNPKPYMWLIDVIIDEKTLEVADIKNLGAYMTKSMYLAIYDTLEDLGIK